MMIIRNGTRSSMRFPNNTGDTLANRTKLSGHSRCSSYGESIDDYDHVEKPSGETFTGYPSRSNGGSGKGSFKEDENDRDYIRNELANQKETRYVDMLRYFVIVILVCSAAAISTVSYVLIQQSEKVAMMSQYNGAASKVIESFEVIINRIGLVNTIGIAATSL
jgi:hypothetical protein